MANLQARGQVSFRPIHGTVYTAFAPLARGEKGQAVELSRALIQRGDIGGFQNFARGGGGGAAADRTRGWKGLHSVANAIFGGVWARQVLGMGCAGAFVMYRVGVMLGVPEWVEFGMDRVRDAADGLEAVHQGYENVKSVWEEYGDTILLAFCLVSLVWCSWDFLFPPERGSDLRSEQTSSSGVEAGRGRSSDSDGKEDSRASAVQSQQQEDIVQLWNKLAASKGQIQSLMEMVEAKAKSDATQNNAANMDLAAERMPLWLQEHERVLGADSGGNAVLRDGGRRRKRRKDDSETSGSGSEKREEDGAKSKKVKDLITRLTESHRDMRKEAIAKLRNYSEDKRWDLY